MVELIDNLIQLVATLVGCVGAGVLFYRHRTQTFFLLACLYATFALGTLYWTLHEVLLSETPQIFYVTELAWIASYVFLLVLEFALSTPEERRFRTPLVWLAPIICIPQLVLYCFYGELVLNLAMCIPTMLAACWSVNGLVYARRQTGKARNAQAFHIVVLCFVAAEYALWTWSCFWISDTLTNPYFWCDFCLTASLIALLPATKKAMAR